MSASPVPASGEPLLSLIAARRSIRRYAPAPVDRVVIERLLHAATRAPSAHNRQPWRFTVLGPVARTRLADAMAAQLRRDRLADGDPRESVEADATRSVARICGAGGAVLIALTLADMDRYGDPVRAEAERTMAVQSVASACTNLLLAAHSLGLGAAWMCAPLFCADTVRSVLDLPDEHCPQALVTFGWPLGPAPQRERRAGSEITRWLD